MPFLEEQSENGMIRDAAYSEYGIPGVPYSEERLIEEGLQEKRFTNPGDMSLPWEGNPVALSGRIHMIRTHKWKFIEEIGGKSELYDLTNDPYELQNLWGQQEYREIQLQLMEKLNQWKCF